jgi:hypothetical protein
MDLLGYLREEAGNQDAAYRQGVLGAERRHAQAVLLARLPSPLMESETSRSLLIALAVCHPGIQ